MGWLDYHLHHFEIKGKHKKKAVRIGIPDFEMEPDDHEIFPGWEIPVTAHFNDIGITAKYLYDYGDDWWHSVELEGYFKREKKIKYPVCIDGARACPPEDCGGDYGYNNIIEVLSDPKNEEYKDLKEWTGNW